MTPTPHRTRQKTELRAQILDAAREIFIADGYDDLSMRKVASKIGCSPTAIYLHFNGLKHPSHYHVVFIASPRSQDYQFEGSSGQRAFQFLSGCVARSMEAGRIRKADVEVTAQTLWMAAHGLVALLISDRSFPFASQKKLIDQLIRTLIQGLKT
jgi:hypothetical protein